MKVTNDIKYVGVNDHQVDLFEGQYVVPLGMAYNSYVIMDEKIAVMDTVDQHFGEEWLANLAAVLGDRKPDYLIVQHMEPDHSANITSFLKVYPDTVVVGNAKTFTFMEQFYGKDPSMQIGGVLNSVHTSYRLGKSDEFVAEACEYTNSFLSLKPRIGIITNIEADHLDFFKDLADVRHSFRLFAENIPADGWLIINTEIPDLDEITNGLKCKVIYFGDNHEKADYYATDIKYNELAEASYTLVRRHGQSQKIVLEVPGKQFIWDSLAAAAACDLCGVKPESITDALRAYKGAGRRFQFKGKINGCQIVDDYAHHPTEVAVTLDAASKIPHRRLIACYQPHTYSRTKALMDDIAKALHEADLVVLTEIFPARETDNLGISSQDLAKKVEALGTPCHVFHTFEEIEDWARKNCGENDLFVTMGGGDVYKIADNLTNFHYEYPQDEKKA